MGHAIQALIGRQNELTEALANYRKAHIIALPQAFALVPMTDELYRELTDEANSSEEFLADISDERFLYLSSKMFQMGRRFSLKTPVALIETDYWSGEGFQKAVAWEDGDVVFGPAVAGNEEGFQLDGRHRDPVNRALMAIGVQGYLMENDDEPKDEFEELGLNKRRSIEAWIAGIEKS